MLSNRHSESERGTEFGVKAASVVELLLQQNLTLSFLLSLQQYLNNIAMFRGPKSA